MPLDLLAAIRVFTTVVDAGSFAAAADKLEISRAMVTRHVAQLEAHLGVRLLHRTTRRLSLTEAGAQYHQRAVQLLALAQEATDVVQRQAHAPSGMLRIASSVAFGHAHLQPAVTAFLRQYPEVQVDLHLAERTVDLVEEGFDLAVRVATRLDPGLVARRLGRVRTLMVAAPAYLKAHGTPRKPQDLLAHNCFSYAHKDWRAEWHLKRSDETHDVPIRGNLRASGGSVLVLAALEGDGIALEPEFMLCEHLAAGRLVRVLPQWQTPELAAHAVYPERQHLPLKVRCFIDHLAQAFADPPPWERWSARRR